MIVLEIGANWEGHSSIKIIQEYYGKVVQKRVSEEMERISAKVSFK